jgi:hypothetical protein|nr:MAG TPA: hypothetical protein [Caudoviricetes sp.]
MKILKRVLKIFLYFILVLYIPGFLFNLYDFISYGGLPNYYTGSGLSLFILLVAHPFYSTLLITQYIYIFIIHLFN